MWAVVLRILSHRSGGVDLRLEIKSLRVQALHRQLCLEKSGVLVERLQGLILRNLLDQQERIRLWLRLQRNERNRGILILLKRELELEWLRLKVKILLRGDLMCWLRLARLLWKQRYSLLWLGIKICGVGCP